jgi:hypothetical protein
MLRSSPVVAATARRERARVTRRGSDGVPWPTAGIRRAGRGVCRQGMTAASGRVSVLVSSNRCSPDKGRGALVLGQSRDRPTRSSALCGARHGSQRLRSPQPGVTRHRRHVRRQAMRLQRGWSWMVCWRPRRRGREVVGGWAPAISSIRWATLAEPRSSHSGCRSGRWQSPLSCRPAAGQHAEVVPTSWQPPGPINVAIESCADQRGAVPCSTELTCPHATSVPTYAALALTVPVNTLHHLRVQRRVVTLVGCSPQERNGCLVAGAGPAHA